MRGQANDISRRSFLRRSMLGGAGVALTPILDPVAAALAQVSTRAKAPSIGVNVGYALRSDETVANVKAFEMLVGRQVDFVTDYGAQVAWRESVTSAVHALRIWREVSVGSRRKMLWHQPLTIKGTPLSDVVAGKHDPVFEVIATNIRNAGFYDAIINLGWDMNGEWPAWSATATTKDAYIDAYRRVAGIFKRISPSFRMCWSPARHTQALAPHDAYPGDAHVDLVGMTVHVVAPPLGPDMAEYFESNVIGHGAVPVAGRQPYALAWLAEFAKLHDKRIVIPELAVGVDIPAGQPPEAAPILDDDVIVTRLADWITQNDVALHCWRDMPNTEGSSLHSRMSRSSLVTGSKPSHPADERPRLSTAYRKAWGSSS